MKIKVAPTGSHPPDVLAVRVFRVQEMDALCIEVQTDWKKSWGPILAHMEGFHSVNHAAKCLYIPKSHANSSTQVVLVAEDADEEALLFGIDVQLVWESGFRHLVLKHASKARFRADQVAAEWQAEP